MESVFQGERIMRMMGVHLGRLLLLGMHEWIEVILACHHLLQIVVLHWAGETYLEGLRRELVRYDNLSSTIQVTKLVLSVSLEESLVIL